MLDTGRCALAKRAWRSKEYVVQQHLYADEARSIDDLKVNLTPVSDRESVNDPKTPIPRGAANREPINEQAGPG